MSSDTLPIEGYERYKPTDYRLHAMGAESLYYIVSPKGKRKHWVFLRRRSSVSRAFACPHCRYCCCHAARPGRSHLVVAGAQPLREGLHRCRTQSGAVKVSSHLCCVRICRCTNERIDVENQKTHTCGNWRGIFIAPLDGAQRCSCLCSQLSACVT